MAVLKKYGTLAALLAILLVQGCKGPMANWPTPSRSQAWAEPTWGRLAEGLQCRLRPDRRTWRAGETPSFKIDIRNRGKRTFALWPAHKLQSCEIEFDGEWHYWPSPVIIDSQVWPLAPGAQYNGLTIELDKRFKIEFEPGKHIVRIAFSPEGVRVISNPVGIEILSR